MMRYLGLGVGHMQPADFPTEIDCILDEAEETYTPFNQRDLSSDDSGDSDDEIDDSEEMEDLDGEADPITYEF